MRVLLAVVATVLVAHNVAATGPCKQSEIDKILQFGPLEVPIIKENKDSAFLEKPGFVQAVRDCFFGINCDRCFTDELSVVGLLPNMADCISPTRSRAPDACPGNLRRRAHDINSYISRNYGNIYTEIVSELAQRMARPTRK